MLEALLSLVVALLAVGLALFLLVIVPLMILGGLFKILVFLVLLPFKLLKALFGLAAGLAVGLGRVAFALLAVLGVGALLVGGVLVLPVLLLLLVAAPIWLVVRILSPRPA